MLSRGGYNVEQGWIVMFRIKNICGVLSSLVAGWWWGKFYFCFSYFSPSVDHGWSCPWTYSTLSVWTTELQEQFQCAEGLGKSDSTLQPTSDGYDDVRKNLINYIYVWIIISEAKCLHKFFKVDVIQNFPVAVLIFFLQYLHHHQTVETKQTTTNSQCLPSNLKKALVEKNQFRNSHLLYLQL